MNTQINSVINLELVTISYYAKYGDIRKSFKDILTTTASHPDRSQIIFKDGSHWDIPWGLFQLNNVLGAIQAQQTKFVDLDNPFRMALAFSPINYEIVSFAQVWVDEPSIPEDVRQEFKVCLNR